MKTEQTVNLKNFEIHISAVLIKKFFRDLPAPIIPPQTLEKMKEIQGDLIMFFKIYIFFLFIYLKIILIIINNNK